MVNGVKLILEYFDDFSSRQLEQLEKLGPLYQEWNQKINVISRRDMEGLYEKHILHSLSIAAAFSFPANSRLMDLGTGGGFPGIPLAIYFPEVKFLLVDSIGKKLRVVSAVAEQIGLSNVETLHSRAEEIREGQFDMVLSRAVAPLKELWKWSRPLLKKKPVGQAPLPGLICLKGGDLAAEIQESGTRPRVIEIANIFKEDYFREKYLLYVTR